MELQAHTFIPSPYQETAAYSVPEESFNNNNNNAHDYMITQGGSVSLSDRMPFQNFGRDPSIHRPSALVDIVDIWALNTPDCGSPLSTSSSMSHAESTHTPSSNGLPMYDTLEPAYPHTQAPLVNNATSTSGVESLWPFSYSEAATWPPQSFVLLYENAPNYEQPPFELTQRFQPQPEGAVSAPYLPYTEPLQYPVEQTVDSEALKTEESGSDGHDSDDSSESDSDDSWYDDSNSSLTSTPVFFGRSQARSNVFRVEGWSTNMRPFNATPDRRHACQVLVGPNGDKPCRKRFQRPEHLRRHVKTVHHIGLERINYCQVPGCHAPFPRSDNFRQHYLTHLTKGKRKGNNEKISFQRMKEILGPKEKHLLRWLKAKLKQNELKNSN